MLDVLKNVLLVTTLPMKIALSVKPIAIHAFLEILAKPALMATSFTQDHVLTNVQDTSSLKIRLATNVKIIVMFAQTVKPVKHVTLDTISKEENVFKFVELANSQLMVFVMIVLITAMSVLITLPVSTALPTSS